MTPNDSNAAGATRTPTRIIRTAAPLRQEAIASIRASILAFDYEPGARLVEKQLCDMLGVSRTVVREALRHLEAEGLVRIVANHGPVVAEITEVEAIAIFEVRAGLEALAAGLFAQKASLPEREQLELATERVGEALGMDSLADWIAAKDEYYATLLDGAHNEILRQELARLQARVQLLRRLSLRVNSRRKSTLAEIRQITRHAVAGEVEEASEAARAHVQRAGEIALEQLRLGSAAADVADS